MPIKLKTKKTQAELITTVLLILIGIAAVVLVSAFVMNLVRTNLKGTECFATTGQLEINTEGGYSYFNSSSSSKTLYLSVKRGTKDFNLSGILVVFGTGLSTKSIKIISGQANANAFYYNVSGDWANDSGIKMPSPGEISYYRISAGALGISEVSQASIAPILEKATDCEKTDEKEIYSK